jgi:uncharacterized protein YbjT (DUF2867 family)
VRDLARQHTEAALETLVRIMQRGKSDAARLAAAVAILDRAWGKPVQALEHSGPDGERPFPSPTSLTDAQLERVLGFARDLRTELEANGGPPS